MKTTLQLIIVFILLNAPLLHSQNTIKIEDINIADLGDGQTFGHKRDEAKTPITGKVRIITGYTTEYIDADFNEKGLAIGKWEYYKEKRLRSYSTYKDGYKDGEWASLSYSGDVEEKGEYLKGEKNGKWMKYFNNSDIPKEVKTYSNGDLVNTQTYYTSGKLESDRNFLNRKEHGHYKKYNNKGDLTMDENYANGKLAGKQFKYMHSNLNDYIETSNYNDKGRLDGDFQQEYAETKKIKVKGKYKNGQKEGKWIYNSLDGTPTKEETYEQGELKETRKF